MVSIQFLRVDDPQAVCEALRQEGWQLHATTAREVRASLPGVQKGKKVRASLYRVGLLISSAVRIEFMPERSVRVAGAGFFFSAH